MIQYDKQPLKAANVWAKNTTDFHKLGNCVLDKNLKVILSFPRQTYILTAYTEFGFLAIIRSYWNIHWVLNKKVTFRISIQK